MTFNSGRNVFLRLMLAAGIGIMLGACSEEREKAGNLYDDDSHDLIWPEQRPLGRLPWHANE